MEKIAVFCSASDRIDSSYIQLAETFGKWLGTHGKTLVYGGSTNGIMGAVARETKRHGGMVVGMVPTRLEELNMVNDDLDVTFRTDTLSDRKDLMVQESDIVVAFPGGVGTLDEIFHVMAAASIGYHRKKVVLFNPNGFWDLLLQFMDKLEKEQFAHAPLKNYYLIANNLEELEAIVNG